MDTMIRAVCLLLLLLTLSGCSSQLAAFDSSKVKLNVDGDSSAYKIGYVQKI